MGGESGWERKQGIGRVEREIWFLFHLYSLNLFTCTMSIPSNRFSESFEI